MVGPQSIALHASFGLLSFSLRIILCGAQASAAGPRTGARYLAVQGYFGKKRHAFMGWGGMTGGLVAFCREMDRCWLEQRFEDLAACLDPDIVFVTAGQRIEGRADALDSYRQFMVAAKVENFNTSNYRLVERGDSALVEYDWSIAWMAGGEAHEEQGHEVLLLALQEKRWRVMWRLQMSR